MSVLAPTQAQPRIARCPEKAALEQHELQRERAAKHAVNEPVSGQNHKKHTRIFTGRGDLRASPCKSVQLWACALRQPT
eukprot:2927561-Alexandrium_andersonii.AAC.1